MDTQNIEKPRKSYWKFVLGFFVVIILVGGGFFIWDKYLSSSAKSQRQMEKQYDAYMKWEERYKQAMREDIYGGKTPEETLKMFIEALKKEDIELASKYFMLDTNEQSYNAEYYLTRKKPEEALKKAKEKRELENMVRIISEAVPDPSGSSYDGDYGFIVYNKKKEIISEINMELNRYSGVWKIQSL